MILMKLVQYKNVKTGNYQSGKQLLSFKRCSKIRKVFDVFFVMKREFCVVNYWNMINSLEDEKLGNK